jgi:hypothetical protein
MADTPQTTSLITLAQTYAGPIVRQINRTSTALKVLSMVPCRGKNVAWAVEGSGMIAEAYAEGADGADYGSDEQAGPYLALTRARSMFHLSGDAQLVAANAGLGQANDDNIRLFARNIQNGLGALASLINGYIYSGTGSSYQPVGLATAIGDASATYATIVPGTSTWWVPTVNDPGSDTTLSQSQIREDVSEIYTASGEFPDLALVSPPVFNQVLGLFDSRQQLVHTIDSLTLPKGKIALSGNYMGVECEGVVFLRDKDATVNRIYYINSNQVEIQFGVQPQLVRVLQEAGVNLTIGEVMQLNDGWGPVPLLALVEPLAKSGDSDKCQIKTYYQLAVKKRSACGCRKHVLVAS